MVVESPSEVDAENPNPADGAPAAGPQNAATGQVNKKRKVIALFTFLVVAGIILIVVGVTVGNKGSGSSDPSLQDANNGANDTMTTQTTSGPTTPATTGPTNVTSATTQLGSGTDDASSPEAFEVQFLQSVGPISSRVRIANPGVANGYNSCADLKDDILNAVKYYANFIIIQQREYSYSLCDLGSNCTRDGMCRSGNCVEGKCIPTDSPSQAPTYGATPTVGSSLEGGDFFDPSGGSTPGEAVLEDSFDTNTQVDGVDEADVVKANADYTFAAYGDILWTWNSTDASKGMSMTQMPQEPEDPNCTYAPSPQVTPFPVPSPVDDTGLRTPFPTEAPPDNTQREWTTRRNLRSGYPCQKPKPRILSLLLAGSRLTALVSQPDSLWGYDGGSIISEDKIFIRVYDVEIIPTDGSALTLLGEQEIKGEYTSARSIGSKGVVISQSFINTSPLVGDLYRWKPQYCGHNSTEYESKAAEVALGKVDSFTEQMIDELALQLDGTCDNLFQIAAMQSGNSTASPNGDMISQLVRVTSFDMSFDFDSQSNNEDPPHIQTNVAGAFASGYLHSVYASQDFAATVNVGNSYDLTSGEWQSATFIQGFDLSGSNPKPFSYAELPGEPLNQYSLDYYQNHLRVVTTESQWWPERKTTNKLWVLKVPERGPGLTAANPKMELTGETGHLGKPGEEVFAVRFMADKAYVVTFEQTDPFYVLNVTDPTNPQVLGELEIPGFSSYLHPIQIEGVDMMIGVGRYVDPVSGINDAAKISLFDVSDPMNPTENATYIDMGAYSSAGNDFYSFRYLNLNQKLILPKSKYTWGESGNFDGFVVYDVKLGNITPHYEIEHADSYDIYNGCWYPARMPARSLVFQSQLTTILSHSVISTDLATGLQNWNVSLDNGLDKAECSGYFW